MPQSWGVNNKLVTKTQYEELKKRMKAKLMGQANVGIDPDRVFWLKIFYIEERLMLYRN